MYKTKEMDEHPQQVAPRTAQLSMLPTAAFCPLMSPYTPQAGPSNAIFFLFYDALKVVGTAVLAGHVATSTDLMGAAAGTSSTGLWPTAIHLGASSVATIPSNLVRTPAEVVKQRLQVPEGR